MAPKLGAAKREEYRVKAWEMSGQGMHNTEIAKELNVSRNTVTSLMNEEKLLRREAFPDADLEAIRTYQAVIRKAWEDYKTLDKKSLNLSGLLNSIISAQKAIDDITGAKAPQKSESKVDVNYRDYTTGDELTRMFEEIDAFIDEGHGNADSEESVDSQPTDA